MPSTKCPTGQRSLKSGSSLLVYGEESALPAAIHSILRQDYVVEYYSDVDRMLRLASSGHFDRILIDIQKSGQQTVQLLQRIRRESPDLPVMVVCDAEDISIAVEAVRAGASDFLIKEIELTHLRERLERASDPPGTEPHRVSMVAANPSKVRSTTTEQMVLGKSERMLQIMKVVRRAAWLPVPVLLLGESGTGKELFARWIHRLSNRSEGPFVALNLTAVPSDLLESTLFGHVKGAFTGAHNQRVGKFAQAREGTLLLDEIAELSTELQPKLLRVLQEGEFEMVGGERTLINEARIVAATNQDIVARVEDGSFRSDLFYRLNVITITLPPLRERREDIPDLIDLFLKRYCRLFGRPLCRLSHSAMQAMMDHKWPGNIRELENTIQRGVAVADEEIISEGDLFNNETPTQNRLIETVANQQGTLEEMERQYIEQILRQTGGHQGQTCKILNIDRKTLKSKIVKYGLLEILEKGEGRGRVIGEIHNNKEIASKRVMNE